jgi:hypothetical protein
VEFPKSRSECYTLSGIDRVRGSILIGLVIGALLLVACAPPAPPPAVEKPSPTPTPTPMTELTLEIVSVTSPVGPGHYATLVAKTALGANSRGQIRMKAEI